MTEINIKNLVLTTLNTLNSFETKVQEVKENKELSELYDHLMKELRSTKETINFIKTNAISLSHIENQLIDNILKNIFNLEKEYPTKDQQQKVTALSNALFWQFFNNFKEQLLIIEKDSSLKKKVVKVDKDLLRGS